MYCEIGIAVISRQVGIASFLISLNKQEAFMQIHPNLGPESKLTAQPVTPTSNTGLTHMEKIQDPQTIGIVRSTLNEMATVFRPIGERMAAANSDAPISMPIVVKNVEIVSNLLNEQDVANGGHGLVDPLNKPLTQQIDLQKVSAQKAESTGSSPALKKTKDPSFTKKVVQFFSNILSFFRNLWSSPAAKSTTVASAMPRPPIVSVATGATMERPNPVHLAQAITAPILKIITAPNMGDKTVAELKQHHTELQEASQACSPKNLEAMAKTHTLSKEDMQVIQAEIDRIRDQVQAFTSDVATAAPQAMLKEVAAQSLSELHRLTSSQIQSDLKSLGCRDADQQRVETALQGLKHMAEGLGAAASEISLTGMRYTGTSPQVSEKMYADIPKDTRLALANLYGDGVLAATKETAQFFKQAGVHMQFFPTAALASNIASGDYSTLMALQRPPIGGDTLQIRFQSFDRMPLNLAMNGADSTEKKSRVLVQHGLQTTLDKLAQAVTLQGTDGHTVKINTTAFKFDAITVRSLLKCAKPEDKKQFDLLFASAMILQHKLDSNAPMHGPVSLEFAESLTTVLGFTDSEEVSQLVNQGFQSQGDVTNALSFMTRFAARLGARDDIQKTMIDLVASPMEAIEKFEAALLQSALNIGGTDSRQAASMLQGALRNGDSEIGGVDVLQAAKRSPFKKIVDMRHTVATRIFDARKGIHTHADRLTRLDYDNKALDQVLAHIDSCDAQLATIDAEWGGLEKTGVLPAGIEIQHVRHVVNADLAREEISTITTGAPFSRPDVEMSVVSPEALGTKLSFATLPRSGVLTRQSAYKFKQDDMPSMIKAEFKEGKTFLALYDRQPGRPESEDTLVGYLDPARDAAFIRSYVQKAGDSITHADNASHNQTVRGMSLEERESAIRKDVLTDSKKAITGEKNTAILEKTKREAKITTLTATQSTAFKSDQKAVRVAIAEYVRAQLGTVSRPDMTEKMDAIVQSLNNNDPAALTAITGNLVSADAQRVASLIQTEARSFTGPETFGQWQAQYSISDATAQKDQALATTMRESSTYQRMQNDAAASDLINGLQSEGDHVTLSFGQRIEVSTAVVSRAVTAVFTGGVVQASASGKSEKSDDITLLKTDKGYQIQLEKSQLKEFGMNSIFAEVATVGLKAGGSSNVGYHLDFNSAEKAAQFLSAIASGDTATIQDKACLGLPSAISLRSGKAFFGGVSVGLQLSVAIPGIDSALNFGNVGMSVSGERDISVVGDTRSTTTMFGGKFSYNPESLGGALGSLGAAAVSSKVHALGVVTGTLHGEASLSREQRVSVTQPPHGAIQAYEITDTVACDFFGIQDINLANMSSLAVNKVLATKGSPEDLEGKLDKITAGNTAQKAAVLALLAKAEVGQKIAISRQLPTDTLFDLNNLLTTLDATGQPKSAEALKADKAAADKITQDPNAYVITAFSLTTVAKEADNSRTNVVNGVATITTGIVDVTKTATGAHITLETVHVG